MDPVSALEVCDMCRDDPNTRITRGCAGVANTERTSRTNFMSCEAAESCDFMYVFSCEGLHMILTLEMT